MRVGVISSSGGSVIFEAYKILRKINLEVELIVVIDRECGIENLCLEYNILCHKIIESDNLKFSKLASNYFTDIGNVDFVLLFFKRLVTDILFKKFPVINIHPSLLPSFRGFSPIEKALLENVKFFGATIHLVDYSIDGGKIIGQIIAPLVSRDIAELNKISFLQKTYLVLLIIDLYNNKSIYFNIKESSFGILKSLKHSFSANPTIENYLLNFEFNELLKKEGVNIFYL